MTKHLLFLDSGAFSVKSGVKSALKRKGGPVTLQKYIEYLHQHKSEFTRYIAFDVIGMQHGEGGKPSWENCLEMERNGLTPIPVYHYQEDKMYLKKYIEKYEYVGVTAKGGPGKKLDWLDEIWSKILTDENGIPRTRVHGFALTSLDIMKRYPWRSVDSASWCRVGGVGSLLVLIDNEMVQISTTDRDGPTGVLHINNLNPQQRERLDYVLRVEYGLPEEILVDLTHYQTRFIVNAMTYIKFVENWKVRPFKKQQLGIFDVPWDGPAPKQFWDHMNFFLAGETGIVSNKAEQYLLNHPTANRLVSFAYPKDELYNAWSGVATHDKEHDDEFNI